MYDILISGGTIIDGSGQPQYAGDIAITGDRIVAVGDEVDGTAKRVIDADGSIVTPGWVDIHTHYDGQVTWDDELAPSSMNGVTTAVMGNCGVGFAPVVPGSEQTLIELMEGVEDIPGAALYEGIPWGEWETFADYLDVLGARTYALDIGAQIPHGAVRYYAMGERGRRNEDATSEDIQAQAKIVEAALGAGALGFTSSRTIGHRALMGEPVPGTFAADEEVLAFADAMKNAGRGVFELIPASALGDLGGMGDGEQSTQFEEFELMRKFSIASGRPVTFTLLEAIGQPHLWREILAMVAEANAAGAQLFPQVSSRPIGVLTGLSAYHAFMRKPLYLERLADLSLAERVQAMRDPEVRQTLMSQESVAPDEPGSMDNLYGLLTDAAPAMVALTDPVDYEPGIEDLFGSIAATTGSEILDVVYDFLLEDGGTRFARLASPDSHGAMSVLNGMLTDPTTVTGLSDAGAHVTMICDGTMPTTQLTMWTRDCAEDLRIPIEDIVHKQTLRNASLYGLADRGALAAGMRADINVIDHAALAVSPPVARHDLPAGGTRLIQGVTGYVATVCAGEVTRDRDADTGARPGRLVRST
ncbi:N-acyl-D-amino-acid deacylase family protein [Ilumatobacter sp.]|uniref:N-acyl-D-amino-acid deacylase family protein n=1 Tax=Ilumatobacter sp. TaxID=1967498 RepID=UPI003C3AA5CD